MKKKSYQVPYSMRKHYFYIPFINFIFVSSFQSNATVQRFGTREKIDYKIWEQDLNKTTTYLVDEIEFVGLQNVDEELLRNFIDIKEKKSIDLPSNRIRDNIEKLLDYDFIEHVACFVTFIDDIHIKLIFEISEFPMIEGYEFVGISKAKEDKLIGKIRFSIKKPASNKYLTSLRNKITRFYVQEEGCKIPNIDFQYVPVDDNPSRIILKIVLPEIKKTYVNKIKFYGNENISSYFLKPELSLREKPKFTLFKDVLYKIITLQPLRKDGYLRTGYTKEDFFRYFKNNVIFIPRTKFNIDELKRDQEKILDVFSQYGYNDAEILKTTVKYYKNGAVDLEFLVDEGEKFYINSVEWTGNLKYETKLLNKILNIKAGDVFCLSNIKQKIYEPGGLLALYQNYGFLKSNIEPVVVKVNGNKVDLEMRVYEGDIYKINSVGIVGNTITFDEIIRRKLFVQPGNFYSRADIMYSMQNLIMSGLFDAKNINPTIDNINENNKTVDVNFNIKNETPSFRLEGGLNSDMNAKHSVRGNLGFKCNNVSILDMLQFKGFLGGGQNLNLAYHFYSLKKHSIEFAFDNPYLSYEKFPWGFDICTEISFDNESEEEKVNEQQRLNEFNLGINFYKQLPWENGSYKLHIKPNYKYYSFNDLKLVPNSFKKYQGVSHEFTMSTSFIRDTQDDIFFPRTGSRTSFNFTTTPPFGWFKDFTKNDDIVKRLKFRDFASVLLEENWYLNIWNDFVLTTNFKHGHSFSYSDKLVTNKFALGGGLANKIIPYGMLALKNVPLRGYKDNQYKLDLDDFGTYGGKFFDIFTTEIRYLLFNLSGSVKMYVLGFFDAGILYNEFADFKIEDIKKSAGFGFRFMLPMLGVLGVDWGYGIDNKKLNNWEFHFQIGA